MHRLITDRLLLDHRNIGNVLTLMRMQLDILRPQDAKGFALLSNATNYLIHYPGVLHHPLEEVMFDRVADQEPGAGSVQRRLREEHSHLTTSATGLVARIGLQQLSAEPNITELRDTGIAYILAYGDHISFEEREVLPLALDTLSAQQWFDIRSKMAWEDDPLFNRDTLSLYDNLYDALMHGAPAAKQ